MIKYYKEMENPNEFEINLCEHINNPKINIKDCDIETKDRLLKIVKLLVDKDPLLNLDNIDNIPNFVNQDKNFTYEYSYDYFAELLGIKLDNNAYLDIINDPKLSNEEKKYKLSLFNLDKIIANTNHSIYGCIEEVHVNNNDFSCKDFCKRLGLTSTVFEIYNTGNNIKIEQHDDYIPRMLDATKNYKVSDISTYDLDCFSFIDYNGLDKDIKYNANKINKLIYLFDNFKKINSIDIDWNLESLKSVMGENNRCDEFLSSCVNLLDNIKNLDNLNKFICYIKDLLIVLKGQKKISDEDMNDILNYLDSIETKKELYLSNNNFKTTIKQINAWYITPYGDLFNPGDSHKERNLVYLLDHHLLCNYDNKNKNFEDEYNYEIKNRENIKKSLDEVRKNGYVTFAQFRNYINYAFRFFNLDYIGDAKQSGNFYSKKSYDKNIVTLVLGVMSAEVAVIDFFEKLHKNSNDYERDVKFIKDNLSTDQLLIRCCGFHKILSDLDVKEDNTIVTSDINYKENFKEYIKKGWKIVYIKPYCILDGMLQEQPDYHEKLLEFHNVK